MHVIHDIAFEVDVVHDESQLSWEQYYSDFLQQILLPKIERLCDRLHNTYPNVKCSIEEIDIEVAVDTLDLHKLQEKIIAEIEEKFSNVTNNETKTYGSVHAIFTSLASPFEALTAYLKNGILPSYLSVKNFKEWLGNVVQFTADEKVTLTTLFITNTQSIERMLSLLRNDIEKFMEIIESKQQITQQYIKFEEEFFKKFLKQICEKARLTYQEAQAEIWFKTLGFSSSMMQFSKTFMQLLQAKAQAEHKRFTAINLQQLTVLVLQAIVQYEAQQPINITIEKIFTIVSISEEKTTNIPAIDSKNKIAKTNKINSETPRISAKNKAQNSQKSSETFPEKISVKNDASSQESSLAHQNETDFKKEQRDKKEVENSQGTVSQKKSEASDQQEPNKTDKTAAETLVANSEKSVLAHDDIADKIIKNHVETEEFNAKQSDNTLSKKQREITTNQATEAHQNENTSNSNPKTKASQTDTTLFEKLARNHVNLNEIPLTTEKAGLILLHPFLAQFFAAVNVINKENQILNNEKACLLLHYLATGNEEVTDVELTLEKICLGISPDIIIDCQTPLTAQDKALCEELLVAVVQNWAVLKNSTSNTLRDMFLKREGTIFLKTDSVKMDVERLAQDILLDRIPWNIRLFKLKWMDQMMHVTW